MLQGRALPLGEREYALFLLHLAIQWEDVEKVEHIRLERIPFKCVETPDAALSRIKLWSVHFREGDRSVELAAADVLEQLGQVLVIILLASLDGHPDAVGVGELPERVSGKVLTDGDHMRTDEA